MTTLCGTISEFIRCTWNIATPGTVDVAWQNDWFDYRTPAMPQVTVSNLTSTEMERYSTAGSLTYKYKPIFLVNVWQQIPRGSSGTAELQRVEDMRFEVARLFRTWFSGTASTNYAGSLTPFAVLLPQDYGVARHEMAAEPRMLRYEITLVGTRNNEN